MKNEYPVLPHISYGKVDDKGFFISLPFKGISLNAYRKLHHGAIKKYRSQYKSIIDIIVIASFKKNYIEGIDDNGLLLKKALFDNPIEIEWFVTFLNKQKIHDVGNYTQKIMLDAIVDSGILFDDDEEWINKESVMFGLKGYDSITCFMKGDINNQMLLKSVESVSYKSLLEAVGIKNGRR